MRVITKPIFESNDVALNADLKSFTAEDAAYLRDNLEAPYVGVSKAALGNDMLMILISLEPKALWEGGYVENSPYTRISLDTSGKVNYFTGKSVLGGRNGRVKSLSDFCAKVNKQVLQAMASK